MLLARFLRLNNRSRSSGGNVCKVKCCGEKYPDPSRPIYLLPTLMCVILWSNLENIFSIKSCGETTHSVTWSVGCDIGTLLRGWT